MTTSQAALTTAEFTAALATLAPTKSADREGYEAARVELETKWATHLAATHLPGEPAVLAARVYREATEDAQRTPQEQERIYAAFSKLILTVKQNVTAKQV